MAQYRKVEKLTRKQENLIDRENKNWMFKIIEVDGPEAKFDIEETLADLLIDLWSKVRASDGSDTNWYRALCKINEFLSKISAERGGDGKSALSDSTVLYFELVEDDYEKFSHHRLGHRQRVPLNYISEEHPPNPGGATGNLIRIHPSYVRVYANAQ